MQTALFVIVILGMLILAFVVIPRFLIGRAMRQVIRIFRESNTTTSTTAKTADELGIKAKGVMEGIFRGRDYKPTALNLLMNAEIVQTTDDGKLYLSEERLFTSGIER
jgi:hypothetical protein